MAAVDPADLSLAGRRLFEQFAHLPPADDGTYPYATVCAALAAPVDDLYDLLAGADDPWAAAFDPTVAAETLRSGFALALALWVGQFAGIDPRVDLPAPGQYVRLRETSGSRRASVQAIEGAARQRLIGPDGTPQSATVYITERIGGSPYVYAVATLVAETPDVSGTTRDLQEQRPAGYQFTYTVIAGGTYAVLYSTHTDYADVKATFASYMALRADPSVT